MNKEVVILSSVIRERERERERKRERETVCIYNF